MSRELDAEIAEKVMGLTPVKNEGGMVFTRRREWVDEGDYYYEGDRFVDEVPHYSTDIAAAWQVAEKMHERGLNVSITADYGWRAPWECCMHLPGSREQWPCADADTAPLAICQAALKAVENTP